MIRLCSALFALIFAVSAPIAAQDEFAPPHRGTPPISIYYVDASFSGCHVMGDWCPGPRIETYLHALAALGGDAVQSDAITNGALSADLQRVIHHRFSDYWGSFGEPVIAPKHIVLGYSGDIFARANRHRVEDLLLWLNHWVVYHAPKTTIWAMQYPPLSGCNDVCGDIVEDWTDYELFRDRYAGLAKLMPNVRLLPDALDGWKPTNAPHPQHDRPDYHLDSDSALNAALRIYTGIRDAQQQRMTDR